MEGRLPEHKHMMEVIMEALQSGEQSISGIGRVLADHGFRMHRIMLSGYLRALVDAGILAERRIKPVTLYSIVRRQDTNLYELVGNAVKSSPNLNSGDSALVILYAVLRRPVFLTEIERCGVKKPVNFQYVSSDRRKDLIKKLAESGIMIPETDMLVVPKEMLCDTALDGLSLLINGIIDSRRYTLPDNGKKQKTLDFS